MKIICIEKISLTSSEVELLEQASDLLAAIYRCAKDNGDIQKLAGVAMDNIVDLLSDEYSDVE